MAANGGEFFGRQAREGCLPEGMRPRERALDLIQMRRGRKSGAQRSDRGAGGRERPQKSLRFREKRRGARHPEQDAFGDLGVTQRISEHVGDLRNPELIALNHEVRQPLAQVGVVGLEAVNFHHAIRHALDRGRGALSPARV